MKKRTIAIVAGGDSSELPVSLRSAQGIYSFIDKERYNLYIVMMKGLDWHVQLPDETTCPIDRNDFSFQLNGEKITFDFAYITIHGTPGENGRLQGYFDMMGIPYSCCGVLAAALTFNKFVCNQYLRGFGVRIAEFPPLDQGEKTSLGVRAKTLAQLKAWSINPYPFIIVVPYASLARPIAVTSAPAMRLSEGVSKFSEVTSKLATLGYERVVMVEKEGDWSLRGGIVDIWSPGDEFPIRCEFFGEDLESLRTFNAATQRSLERIQFAEVISASYESDEKNQDFYLSNFLPDLSVVLAIEHNGYDVGRYINDNCSIVYTGEPAPNNVDFFDFQTVSLPGFSELDVNNHVNNSYYLEFADGLVEKSYNQNLSNFNFSVSYKNCWH